MRCNFDTKLFGAGCQLLDTLPYNINIQARYRVSIFSQTPGRIGTGRPGTHIPNSHLTASHARHIEEQSPNGSSISACRCVGFVSFRSLRFFLCVLPRHTICAACKCVCVANRSPLNIRTHARRCALAPIPLAHSRRVCKHLHFALSLDVVGFMW